MSRNMHKEAILAIADFDQKIGFGKAEYRSSEEMVIEYRALVMRMASAAPSVVVRALKSDAASRAASYPVSYDLERQLLLRAMLDYKAASLKIPCIKALRERFGLSLKDAKDICDYVFLNESLPDTITTEMLAQHPMKGLPDER